MTLHCTCGSSLSTDDEACPHCGKPVAPGPADVEPVAPEQSVPEERLDPSGLRVEKPIGDVFVGAVLYSMLIPASTAVMIQDLIGSATVPTTLLSLGVSFCAGFCTVTLVRWAFRTARYSEFPFDMGKLTGLMIVVLALGLSTYGELTETPKEYVAVAGAYLGRLPIAVRASSQMAPELYAALVENICFLSFAVFHLAAAMLGSVLCDAIQQAKAKD